MSETERPDPIVRERTIRDAIDDITRRTVSTQEQIGIPIPGGRAVDDWVQGAVVKQVKIHEDRCRNGVPESAQALDVESPARIDRGEVGEGTTVVSRDLRSTEWEQGRTAPAGRAHVHGGPPMLMSHSGRLIPQDWDDRLLQARLNLLGGFPEWAQKLQRAAWDAVALSRREGRTDDDPETIKRLTVAMLGVVELSAVPVAMGGLGLGDYRRPKANGPTKIIVSGPTGPAPLVIPEENR